jgi:uncharacterized SAM-binding protein YcdF (DUF218 family)
MFLFSKLFGLLLNPTLWIVVAMLLAWAARDKRLRGRFLTAAAIMTLFFTNGWVVKNLLSRYSAKPMPMRQGETYEAGILLAGMAGYDPKSDWSYFTQDADRFIQTLWLYKKGHIRKIMILGGQGDPFANHTFVEAEYLAGKFREMGVLEGDIAWEGRSRNTIENAVETRRLSDSLGVKGPFVLVTSAYHMPRSMWLFKSRGIDVRPFPAGFIAKPSGDRLTWRSLIPSAGALEHWRVLLHEVFGSLFARLSAK